VGFAGGSGNMTSWQMMTTLTRHWTAIETRWCRTRRAHGGSAYPAKRQGYWATGYSEQMRQGGSGMVERLLSPCPEQLGDEALASATTITLHLRRLLLGQAGPLDDLADSLSGASNRSRHSQIP
jgi:hypothetical protein